MSDQHSDAFDGDAIAPVKKRKASVEFSDNPHTIKARKRNERISQDPFHKEVLKAKQADQGAVTYAKKLLKKSHAYKVATDDQKIAMEQSSATQARLRRERDGKDWQAVARRLGIGEAGGLYAVEDDGNPVWADIEYESGDDVEFEQRWRNDEKENGEVEVNLQEAKDLKSSGLARLQQSFKDKRLLEFRTWQKKWFRSFRSFKNKNRKLSAGGMEFIERTSKPYISRLGVFHPWESPQHFFTTGEKAIWRNLVMWAFDDNEWIDLPGPAEWWPEDIDSTGFFFSDQATGHMEAFKLILTKEDPDMDLYQLVFPSHEDLRVMIDDSQTRMALKAFFQF